MLLMQEPQLLRFDEPVAGMTDDETMRGAKLLESLAWDYTLVVVEHVVDFVAGIADRVTMLHKIHVSAEGSTQHVQNNKQVIEVCLGRCCAATIAVPVRAQFVPRDGPPERVMNRHATMEADNFRAHLAV